MRQQISNHISAETIAGYQCHFWVFWMVQPRCHLAPQWRGPRRLWQNTEGIKKHIHQSGTVYLLPHISYVKHPSEKPRCLKDQKMTARRQIIQRRRKTMSVARKLELARVSFENWSNLKDDPLTLAPGFNISLCYKSSILHTRLLNFFKTSFDPLCHCIVWPRQCTLTVQRTMLLFSVVSWAGHLMSLRLVFSSPAACEAPACAHPLW